VSGELSIEPLERSVLEGVRREEGGPAGRADLGLLPIFEDERPLQGLSAYLDWRFGGRLSSMLREGLFTGSRGEALLMPASFGLPVERLVLFGLGSSEALDEARAEELAERLFAVAANMGARDVLLAIPGELSSRGANEALLGRLVALVEAREESEETAQPAAPDRWWLVAEGRVVARLRRLISGPPRAAATASQVGPGEEA
jgi:hypothetical protein